MARGTEDHLSQQGASRLAHKIRAYWRRKGLVPNVVVEKVELKRSNLGEPIVLHAIRSNMVNGLPR